MSNRPWMPLYVADFIADTTYLSAAETGAYMTLIMHYWQNGSLPNDDKKLARIARMTPDEWADARDTIAEFFTPEWKHKRCDEEIARAVDISEKRANAGKTRNKRPANAEQMLPSDEANAEQLQTHLHLHSQEGIEAPTGPSIPSPHMNPRKIAPAAKSRRAFVAFDTPQWRALEQLLAGRGKRIHPPDSVHEDKSGWWFDIDLLIPQTEVAA